MLSAVYVGVHVCVRVIGRVRLHARTYQVSLSRWSYFSSSQRHQVPLNILSCLRYVFCLLSLPRSGQVQGVHVRAHEGERVYGCVHVSSLLLYSSVLVCTVAFVILRATAIQLCATSLMFLDYHFLFEFGQ